MTVRKGFCRQTSCVCVRAGCTPLHAATARQFHRISVRNVALSTVRRPGEIRVDDVVVVRITDLPCPVLARVERIEGGVYLLDCQVPNAGKVAGLDRVKRELARSAILSVFATVEEIDVDNLEDGGGGEPFTDCVQREQPQPPSVSPFDAYGRLPDDL